MMSVDEALFGSATADAGTVGLDASEVCFMTLADAEQQEAEAWAKLNAATKQLEATPIGMKVIALREQWSQTRRVADAIKNLETLNLRVATGCSRRAVPCGQADHLRDVMATATPTANEVN